jgi:CBS domain-containing protein
MKVKDIMTAEPKTCAPNTNLAEAAHLMWDADCGILPVVEAGKLIGVVTDRDMYIALATRDKRASQLVAANVVTLDVSTCGPEDDISTALATMRRARVRRLPVLGFGDTVLGILSLDDIVNVAGPQKPLSSDAVIETMQAISGHHHPAPHVVVA